jgi:hypothetical protein
MRLVGMQSESAKSIRQSEPYAVLFADLGPIFQLSCLALGLLLILYMLVMDIWEAHVFLTTSYLQFRGGPTCQLVAERHVSSLDSRRLLYKYRLNCDFAVKKQ